MPIEKPKNSPSPLAQKLSNAMNFRALQDKLNKSQARGFGDFDVPLMDQRGRLRASPKSLPELIDDELDMARAPIPELLRGNLKGAFNEYFNVLLNRYRFEDTPENRQAIRDQLAAKGMQEEGDINLPTENGRRNNRQKNTLGDMLDNK
jgi:hypothetical protein